MSNKLPLLFANYSLLFTSLKTDAMREGWQRKAHSDIKKRGLAANKLYRGIYASHFLRSTGTTTISNNRIRTSMTGIVIDWQRSGTHRIDSNYVEIDKRLDTLNAYPRRGIWVGASNGFATTLVFGNAVRNESVQPFTGIGGINLGFNGLTKNEFWGNRDSILSDAPGSGFSFENCRPLVVANNHSQTDLTYNQSSPANAYYFAATPQARIEQNCSDGTQTGFHFFDANPWLDFSRNNIGLHQPANGGLSLRIGLSGYIGEQWNRQNTFQYGNPNTVIARDESQSSGANRFYVGTNTTSPYDAQWLYPRHAPFNPECLDDQFFRCISPTGGIPDSTGCSAPTSFPQWIGTPEHEAQILALANALAMDSISFQYYNAASLHKLRRSVVKDLRDSLLVLPDTGIYIAFKDSLFGANEDLLNKVEEYQTFDKNDTLRYAAIHALNLQLDSLYSLLFALESSFFGGMVEAVSDTLYSMSGMSDEGGEPSIPIVDTLIVLYEQIALTDSLIAIEQASINAALALRLHIADSLNSSIVAQHDFEQYELDINDILIQLTLDTFSLDSTRRQTIEAIAAMCPLAGGVAVYKARSLLFLYNDTVYFDDEALCALPSARLAEKEQPTVPQQDGMKVYPNPSRGQLTVEFERAAMQQIHIYNTIGQRVFTARTNEKTLNIDLNTFNINPGLLLIEAYDEATQRVYKRKVIYEK